MGKFGLVSLAAIVLCACGDNSNNATENVDPEPIPLPGATDVLIPIDLGDYLSSSALASLLDPGSSNSSAFESPISSGDESGTEGESSSAADVLSSSDEVQSPDLSDAALRFRRF